MPFAEKQALKNSYCGKNLCAGHWAACPRSSEAKIEVKIVTRLRCPAVAFDVDHLFANFCSSIGAKSFSGSKLSPTRLVPGRTFRCLNCLARALDFSTTILSRPMLTESRCTLIGTHFHIYHSCSIKISHDRKS